MKILSALSAFALVSCTAIVPTSRMGEAQSDAPGRWSATSQARAGIDTNWVKRIGGSRAESLVDEAFSLNPDMRVAAERVSRAVASAKTAGAALNPKVEAVIDGARSKQSFIGFPVAGGGGGGEGGGGAPLSISDNYGANISVNWEPDIWGFTRAGISAQIAQAQAEGQNYRAARASLAAQVLRAWLALAEANEKIVLAEKSQELLKTTYDIVLDRFESSLLDEGGTASQLRLVQSQLDAARADLAQRQGEREQTIRQLELLMGRYPSGGIKSAVNLPAVPPMPPAGLPSELLLRRPDILAAERQFASSGSLLKQAKLVFYPSIKLTALGGTNSESLRDIVDSNFGVWSLAGSLTQPIWAGGAIRSEEKRIRSEDRLALANLQSVVLRAFGEVEQSLISDRFLALRETAISSAVNSSKEASEAAYADYASGIGDALTLINAQQSSIDLSSQLVSLHRLRLDNRITLHLALGGDYRVDK